MRWTALVLFAAACNRVFGLSDTALGDASAVPFFDTPADAQWMCPTSGPPTFGAAPTFVASGCRGYTIASGSMEAMARCQGGIALGKADAAALTTVTVTPPAMLVVDAPRIFPEGDRAFMTEIDVNGDFVAFGIYTRAGDDSWSETARMPLGPSTVTLEISPPTRGPGERRTIVATSSLTRTFTLQEYSDQGTGTWVAAGPDMLTELGVTRFRKPALTADGLELVGVAGTSVLFASRSSLSAPFGPAVPIAGISSVDSPYLTANCGQLYYNDFTPTVSFVHE